MKSGDRRGFTLLELLVGAAVALVAAAAAVVVFRSYIHLSDTTAEEATTLGNLILYRDLRIAGLGLPVSFEDGTYVPVFVDDRGRLCLRGAEFPSAWSYLAAPASKGAETIRVKDLDQAVFFEGECVAVWNTQVDTWDGTLYSVTGVRQGGNCLELSLSPSLQENFMPGMTLVYAVGSGDCQALAGATRCYAVGQDGSMLRDSDEVVQASLAPLSSLELYLGGERVEGDLQTSALKAKALEVAIKYADGRQTVIEVTPRR